MVLAFIRAEGKNSDTRGQTSSLHAAVCDRVACVFPLGQVSLALEGVGHMGKRDWGWSSLTHFAYMGMRISALLRGSSDTRDQITSPHAAVCALGGGLSSRQDVAKNDE